MIFTKIVGRDDGKLKYIRVEAFNRAFHLNPYLYYALGVLFFPLFVLYKILAVVLYALYWMFLENAERSFCFVIIFLMAGVFCAVIVHEASKTPEEREHTKPRESYEIYNTVKSNGDETAALLRDITNRLDRIERRMEAAEQKGGADAADRSATQH